MTSKNRSFRPSPALAISCLALFLTLAGTAFAVGKNTVRSAQIVDGTIRTVDLRDNAVATGKIAPDAVDTTEIAENGVESSDVAPDSLTAADLGPASVTSSEVADQSLGASDLGPASVGSSELGTVVVRSNSQPLKAGASGGVSVDCLPGEQLLGGGAQPAHFGVEMTSSRPSGNGWLYQAKNANGSDSTITAFALCLG